ncbi:MAG: TauD/TfdA family dioxygenase [Pseudomonadota bacterium]
MTAQPESLQLQPLNRSFGAVVTGIDLRQLDDGPFQSLYDAWLEYALLIFPQQHLAKEEQIAFARRFGDLVEGLEAAEISNVRRDGSLRDSPDDDMMKIIRGNMHWHQDSTYMPIQAKGAVFSAKVVPPAQGDTAFADLRAAWDALDADRRERCQRWSAYHSLVHSQRKLGEETKQSDSEYMGYGLDVDGIPLRPLCKVHPETGRTMLAVGRHAFAIPEVAAEQAEPFLEGLLDFATGDPYRVYQHRWTAGDVLVWDNRSLLHKACAWDFSEPRVMLHSRLAGDPTTEGASLSADLLS